MSQTYQIVLTGSTSGTISIYYQMYSIPDMIEVYYESQVVFTTGGMVSGSQTVYRNISGTDDIVYVLMNAPNPGTGWNFRVGCVS